jgi:uncharacterized protein (TIGR02996 family)
VATDLFISTSELDFLLTAQFAVAFAGEAGESPRLGWWRTDLVSEFGGHDLFQRLLPATWAWAALEGAREGARRVEARHRALHHDPDLLRSLFHPGPAVDRALAERIETLKHGDAPPERALPALAPFLAADWTSAATRTAFADWLDGHGRPARVETEPTPAGRRLRSDPPESQEHRFQALLAAFVPLTPEYPFPHYRVAKST